jgi:demethylmenaquinone methyltransferase/2-methoxy-6-polyprenyl-1,4-benzoquinol methylase
VTTVVGTAESLPIDDASVDFVSMGYALRHVEDINAAFREFRRVLDPAGRFGGGRLCILEVARPGSRLGRFVLRLYMSLLSRLFGLFVRLAPRTSELWSYYWKTIDQCVPPQRVLEALKEAGFVDVKRSVVFGVFSEFTARAGGSDRHDTE